ncbi:MAG TPA: chorismate mutase [bacterium]|nr:chorismate mutase [bacterium]
MNQPAEPNLEDIRIGLDACGSRLLQLFAARHSPPYQKGKLEGVVFLLRFYRTISAGIRDQACRSKLENLSEDDKAIQRILHGSDFPDEQGRGIPLTEADLQTLLFFFDLDDPDIVAVLIERYRWIEQVSLYKKARGIAVRKPDRERELIDSTKKQCQALGLPEELALLMYKRLILPAAFEIEEQIING